MKILDLLKEDDPKNKSWKPSKLISATARAGPSLDSIYGINGSRLKSLKIFSL